MKIRIVFTTVVTLLTLAMAQVSWAQSAISRSTHAMRMSMNKQR